jgi:GTP-binding protein
MRKPIVAIVGRPNVGKSTFFNQVVGKRISIVEDTPGVTRDRIYADAEWLNYNFTLIDTGGIEPNTNDVILSQMRNQAQVAIDTADVIVFMVDGKVGLTPADREIGNMLRKSDKPIVLTVNKIDNAEIPDDFYEFYNLGLGDPIHLSSVNKLNMGDLLDEIVAHFPGELINDYDEEVTKIAVLGKPNVGKSSLINAILGENRVIVADQPGTTRDAIDTPFNVNDDQYVFIDTAGMRKKKNITENIERYSVIRSLTAIERSDVCLILIDATEGVTEQDKKIAGYAHENGKGIALLVNKWDLVDDKEWEYNKYYREVRNEMAFITYAPIMFISALTNKRVDKVIELVKFIAEQRSMRIPTGELNDTLDDAILKHQPPSKKGKRLKIYYGTQVEIQPPTFALFVNDPELSHFSYTRFLENQLREHYEFIGTSIRIKYRKKKSRF